MSAYVIFVREELTDKAEMEKYARAAVGARGDHNIERLAFYGDVEVLEGSDLDRVAILKFDDMDSARKWYNSPEYQAAKPHRLNGAKYQVILVDGFKAT
jgi:uncharacterized protein (DUF1330 family)